MGRISGCEGLEGWRGASLGITIATSGADCDVCARGVAFVIAAFSPC